MFLTAFGKMTRRMCFESFGEWHFSRNQTYACNFCFVKLYTQHGLLVGLRIFYCSVLTSIADFEVVLDA